jgi:hypothetical protein
MIVNRSLERLGLQQESQVEGKRIEKIWVETYDVFLPEDKLISWLNAAHFLTKERTVREELLFREGDTWKEDLGQESSRNLRRNLPLTVAQVVTCKGSSPDSIQVLVVTRDIWSMRASYDLQLTDGRLEYFFIGLFEYNWLGQAETLSPIYFAMNQATMLFAQRYVNPRLGWSRIALREEGGPIFNYRTGRFEGGLAQVRLFWNGYWVNFGRDPAFETSPIKDSQPLYSLHEKWGADLTVETQSSISRTFAQGEVARVSPVGSTESLPLQYQNSNLRINLQGIRSFGYEYKSNLSLGWRLNANVFRFEGTPGESYSAQSITAFNQAYLPLEDRHSLLFVRNHFFEARFGTMMNLNTMGLVEDVQLGPQVLAEVAVATPYFGLDSTFVQPSITARWAEIWGTDALTVMEGTASFRYQPSPRYVGFDDWVNQTFSFVARHATRIYFDFARFVIGARMNLRIKELGRTISTVGGNNFLRGFPSGAFQGFSAWGANAEIRTRPWRLTSYVLLGGAAFLDFGDAFNDPNDLLFRKVHKSAGFGLRLLFPQISTFTTRLDVAFPIDEIYGPSTTFQFQQAF